MKGDMMNVKCNKCGYIGDESEFPQGRDFFQKSYVRSCPKCDNRQNPSDASMRMFPGVEHPFEYVRDIPKSDNPFDCVFTDMNEAS